VLNVTKHRDARHALVRLTSAGEGENAEQTSVLIARGELEDDYDFRRVEVVGPAISGELIDTATLGFVVGLRGARRLYLGPLRMALRHRRDHLRWRMTCSSRSASWRSPRSSSTSAPSRPC
jgi:hypothetical protein